MVRADKLTSAVSWDGGNRTTRDAYSRRKLPNPQDVSNCRGKISEPRRFVNAHFYGCGKGFASTPAMNSFNPASEFWCRNL
jgi:hypothetical protein